MVRWICWLFLGAVGGMPSFRERLPNAYMVECPAGAEGCTSSGWCQGLGHVDCGGGGALGPFGISFLVHGYEWNDGLCWEDSDGDGQSNGYELGDPRGAAASQTCRRGAGSVIVRLVR